MKNILYIIFVNRAKTRDKIATFSIKVAKIPSGKRRSA